MQSLDTNILIHALDQEAPGHTEAHAVYERLFTDPETWVIADQVLFELYRALSNPKVFSTPLEPAKALEVVERIRRNSQARSVGYEIRLWDECSRLLVGNTHRKGLLVFDVVLAVTLKAAGVKRFFTRNVKDFETLGLFEVVDPLG